MGLSSVRVKRSSADKLVHTPNNFLAACLQNCQCKLYAVGMMYSINARISFRREGSNS